MKKLILVLAIALIASPVFADLVVGLEAVDSDTFAVVYSGADTANLPRAFALTLTIDGTGTFGSFVADSYYQGESTAANPKFGIYPARIDILSDGSVNNYGTPEAQSGDPGTTGTGFGTNTLILEFGSLYYGDANKPATSGTLCQINYSAGTATEITMVDEDTYRGGLVLEDGTLGEVSATLDVVPPEPLPGVPTNVSPTNANPKVTTTTDVVWTAGSDATSHKVYFGTVNPPPFAAEVAMPAVTFDTGTMVANTTYYWNVIASNGAGDSAASATWSFTTECYGNMADYAQWVNAGKPDCWCYPRQCKGDADGLKYGDTKNGYYYVGAGDLNVLTNAWKIKNSPKGSGVSGNQGCADFDHAVQGDTKNGYYRVGPGDLNILTTYWKVKESPKGPGVTPTCLPGNRNP